MGAVSRGVSAPNLWNRRQVPSGAGAEGEGEGEARAGEKDAPAAFRGRRREGTRSLRPAILVAAVALLLCLVGRERHAAWHRDPSPRWSADAAARGGAAISDGRARLAGAGQYIELAWHEALGFVERGFTAEVWFHVERYPQLSSRVHKELCLASMGGARGTFKLAVLHDGVIRATVRGASGDVVDYDSDIVLQMNSDSSRMKRDDRSRLHQAVLSVHAASGNVVLYLDGLQVLNLNAQRGAKAPRRDELLVKGAPLTLGSCVAPHNLTPVQRSNQAWAFDAMKHRTARVDFALVRLFDAFFPPRDATRMLSLDCGASGPPSCLILSGTAALTFDPRSGLPKHLEATQALGTGGHARIPSPGMTPRAMQGRRVGRSGTVLASVVVAAMCGPRGDLAGVLASLGGQVFHGGRASLEVIAVEAVPGCLHSRKFDVDAMAHALCQGEPSGLCVFGPISVITFKGDRSDRTEGADAQEGDSGSRERHHVHARVTDQTLTHTQALNEGAALARGQVLAFLFDDSVPEANWLAGVVEPLLTAEDDLAGGNSPLPAVAGSTVLSGVDGRVLSAGIDFFWTDSGLPAGDTVLPFYSSRGAVSVDKPGAYSPPRLDAPHEAFSQGMDGGHRSVIAVSMVGMAIKRNVFHDLGGFQGDGSSLLIYSEANLCLGAAQQGLDVLLVRDAVAVWHDPLPRHTESLAESHMAGGVATEQARFSSTWGDSLQDWVARRLELEDIRVRWIMHCGGSMGLEAATILTALERFVDLRVGIVRYGAGRCEHTDTLSGLSLDSLDALERLRHRSFPGYAPDDVVVYHKDWREMGAHVTRRPPWLVGRYMFEASSISKEWAAHCNTLDEVWVPAAGIKEAFVASGVDANRVHVVPEAVDIRHYDPDSTQPHPAAMASPRADGQRTYVFLSVFKLEERKGWKELVAAYFDTFGPDDPVLLVLRTYIYQGGEEAHDARKVREIIVNYARSALGLDPSGLAPFRVLARDLGANAMPALYAAADAFVLPTHGEGWCLPCVEAMAMALPTCVTNWSGPAAFMQESHSYPLPFEGLVSTGDQDEWLSGFSWAQPSIPAIAAVMWHLFTHPEEGRAVGRRARAYISEAYSPDAVAREITRRLEQAAPEIMLRRERGHALPDASAATSVGEMRKALSTNWLTPRASRTKPLAGGNKYLREIPPLPRPSALACFCPRAHALRIAIVSTYPPVKCGIATYTKMLAESIRIEIDAQGRDGEVEVIALYNPQVDGQLSLADFDQDMVSLAISSKNEKKYAVAASYLNTRQVSLVILQSEFGIFGGDLHGSRSLALLSKLTVPVVTVAHTTKEALSAEERLVLQQHLLMSPHGLRVMTERGRRTLDAHHGLPGASIKVVPHGVPVVPKFPDRAMVRRAHFPEWIGEGRPRPVMLTFGLLHPDKGIADMLHQLPEVLRHAPDTLYVVVGQAHPKAGEEGKKHVRELNGLVAKLNLTGSVIFDRRFVSDQYLSHLLSAADVYVTPYRDLGQAVSGTLSAALAYGCAAFSTPFEHAYAVLRDSGAGHLFASRDTMAAELVPFLAEPGLARIRGMQRRAWEYAKACCTWPKVAEHYLDLADDFSHCDEEGQHSHAPSPDPFRPAVVPHCFAPAD